MFIQTPIGHTYILKNYCWCESTANKLWSKSAFGVSLSTMNLTIPIKRFYNSIHKCQGYLMKLRVISTNTATSGNNFDFCSVQIVQDLEGNKSSINLTSIMKNSSWSGRACDACVLDILHFLGSKLFHFVTLLRSQWSLPVYQQPNSPRQIALHHKWQYLPSWWRKPILEQLWAYCLFTDEGQNQTCQY